MSKTRKKRCRFCGIWFYPHPRSGARQLCCSAAACAKKREKYSQTTWHHEKDPTYDLGRYEGTKQWLHEHPGYLRNYRATHPDYVQKNREQQKKRDQKRRSGNLDIRDALMLQELSHQVDTYKSGNLDIRDPLLPYPVLFLGLMSCIRNLDIQDSIGISLQSIYNRGRLLFRQYVDL